MITDSYRAVARSWRRVMPAARSRPSSTEVGGLARVLDVEGASNYAKP
jgi:hypothetical protein